MPRYLTAIFCVLVLVRPGATHAREAGQDAQARALFSRAEVHFNLQEFDKALALYSRAYKIKPLPGFLFNIGQCQRYLGKPREALFSFKIYLVRVPNPPNREQVEQLIRLMEEHIADGKARADAGKTGPRKGKAGSTGGPDAHAESGSGADDADLDEANKPPKTLWIWTGFATSAALLATGFVTGQMASSRSAEYREAETTLERRRELKDSGETLRTTAIVTLSAGGAAAIATALYYYFGYRRFKKRRTGVTAVPLPGGGALGLRGAF